MLETYFDKVKEHMQNIEKHEITQLKKGAQKVAAAIKQGGIVQLFGCGHSHLLTEEVFYRAGGLAPIKPLLIEPLMLHEGAVTSSRLEKQNDYAQAFMREQDIRQEDVVIVISTSGRNPVPIDVALFAKEKGAYVIGITSLAYAGTLPSKHKEGHTLSTVVDLVIDNHSVTGDAVLSYEQVAVPFAPTSTVIGAMLLNGLFAEVIKLLVDQGIDPPIFLSGNIDGAELHNNALVNRYKSRIPLFQ
ncbi:hypothetical protein GCM10011391_09980 [Pullulanibacillus camelliae]|uniref:UPF0309 protein GCM10011391_09980 n=1 Tax=Pullulanibacillus camelliae TaxID=1707096 RepID=A0A8J2YBI2_9BACL|nr:SIS domain-containing protein [Pullulanibacillus camelliae]GGE33328.1 hypothetical protein GCM10011391_09980 [Pullulanibacillus camelliae]